MTGYYELFRKKLETNSGDYTPEVFQLFNSYIQTKRDLPTIDNDSVIDEVLGVLEQKLEFFRFVVPRKVRKNRYVSRLIKEVDSLIENY